MAQALRPILEKENIRKKNQGNIARLARDMSRNNYYFNGSGNTISIKRNGWGADGQHLVEAIIETDSVVKVVYILGTDTDRGIDHNWGRTVAHLIGGKLGLKNAAIVGASAKTILEYERGLLRAKGHTKDPLTKQDIEDFVRENSKKLQKSGAIGMTCKPICSTSIAAACHFIFAQEASRNADEFFASVASGESLKKGDPAFTLRNYLLRLRSQGLASNQNVTSKIKLMAAFRRAWNAYMKDEKLPRMQLNAESIIKLLFADKS